MFIDEACGQLIQKSWHNLTLRVLNKATLNEEDFGLLARGKHNRTDIEFRRDLPLIVAHWQTAAASVVTHWGQQKKSLVTDIHFSNLAIPAPVWAVIEQYESDIRDIHSVFFRSSSIFCRHEIGPYITMKAPDLHGDCTTNPEEVIYISRLNALPLLYFRDADIGELDFDKQLRALELIEQARDPNFGIVAQKARQELLESNFPKFLPLGAVAMMAPEVFDEHGNVLWKGTDHFSSDLPIDPNRRNLIVSSALFHMALG
jgi:hypothetical protein